MIYECGVDIYFAERERHLAQFVNVHLRGQFTHGDRKERRFHRLGYDLAERRACAVKTKNANFVLGIVRRFKKREALDVVPMRVRDQQRKLDRSRLEFFLQSDPEWPDAGPGIEHDNLTVCAQL